MSKKIFLGIALLICAALTSWGQMPSSIDPKVYNIYDGQPEGSESWTDPEITTGTTVFNVTNPTIEVYKPNQAIDTGVSVIICPGGMFQALSIIDEGKTVAEYFQRNGITGIVLKYRLLPLGKDLNEIMQTMSKGMEGVKMDPSEPHKGYDNLTEAHRVAGKLGGDDGRQAIKYVREHAEELGVNPDKIGIIGFSAGGYVAMDAALHNDDMTRPAFVGCLYGTGEEAFLPEHPIPMFICAPEFDLLEYKTALSLYSIWRDAMQPAELHFIHDANHGSALIYNGREWNEWVDLFQAFLKAVKIL